MSVKPFISVIVPAYNEEQMLPACLAALKAQDYDGPYEIIVVDNACTDHTVEVAGEFSVRVEREPRKGYVHALRCGFAAARGEILACTDADTRVPRNWLSRLAATMMARPDVVAMSGVYSFHDGPEHLHLFIRAFNWLSWHPVGANMAVWRWAYERVGGFDPHINLGADTDLGVRLRRLGRVLIDHRLVVSTSSRRFQVSLLSTLWHYNINYFYLLIFGKPFFANFTDIRYIPQRQLHRGWVTALGVLVVIIGMLTFASVSPGAQAFGTVMAHGKVDQPVVALTFDDGPDQDTAQVLDILAHYQVKGTFFLVGKDVKERPDLARRIVAEGHAIGNHTYSHPLLMAAGSEELAKQELDDAAAIIASTTGIRPTLFRPPRGWRSPWLLNIAREKGYVVVTWSLAPDDWLKPSPSVIVERTLHQVKPGSIILMCDDLENQQEPPMRNAITALPAIIEGLQASGYRFVTVPELLEMTSQSGNVLSSRVGTAHNP